MKDERFYPTNRHGTCVETKIMWRRVVRPYWFCGDSCPDTVDCRECGRMSGHKMDCTEGRRDD